MRATGSASSLLIEAHSDLGASKAIESESESPLTHHVGALSLYCRCRDLGWAPKLELDVNLDYGESKIDSPFDFNDDQKSQRGR